jgi:hypothetical protein
MTHGLDTIKRLNQEAIDRHNKQHDTTAGEHPVGPFKRCIQASEDYAWTWHCCIAVSMQDEGVSHQTSNKAAARFMKLAFDVDVTKFSEWKAFESKWSEHET